MQRHGSKLFFLATVVALGAITFSACAKSPDGGKSNTSPSASAETGKIPVTTSSEEARKEFLKGRDLAEKLLAQASLQHYDKAISLDPNFASAELGRANSSQTAKEFFEHLSKAVSLADKASEGERLLILANQAGANAEAVKQKEYLDKLVAAYPNDERANLNLGGYYFGQQEYTKAIEHYKKSTEINAKYSPAYNILGYAYRQNGDYVSADSGKMDKALEAMDKEYAVAEKINDVAAMTADLQAKSTILVEMGKYDEARTQFERLLKMTEDSAQSQVIKDNTRLFHYYNMVGVMLGKNDIAAASREAEEFRVGAEKSKNPAQVKQAHELAAMIALAQKDYDKAIAELQQTNQQNPYNLYRFCQAYQRKGDHAKATEFCTKAADFNSLPQFNYAFIRLKARKMVT